jgi:hypothetical protein
VFRSRLSRDGRSRLAGCYRGFWLHQGVGIVSESKSSNTAGTLPIIGEVKGIAVGTLLFEIEVLTGRPCKQGAALQGVAVVGRGVRLYIVVAVQELRGGVAFLNMSPL